MAAGFISNLERMVAAARAAISAAHNYNLGMEEVPSGVTFVPLDTKDTCATRQNLNRLIGSISAINSIVNVESMIYVMLCRPQVRELGAYLRPKASSGIFETKGCHGWTACATKYMAPGSVLY